MEEKIDIKKRGEERRGWWKRERKMDLEADDETEEKEEKMREWEREYREGAVEGGENE